MAGPGLGNHSSPAGVKGSGIIARVVLHPSQVAQLNTISLTGSYLLNNISSTISLDAEQMTVLELNEATPDTMTVTRAIYYTPALARGIGSLSRAASKRKARRSRLTCSGIASFKDLS